MDERTFSDAEVLKACRISEADLRRLIQWKAVTPTSGGKGRGNSRRWDMGELRRISMTSTLRQSGFSLQMALTLAYLRVGTVLLTLFDPQTLAMNAGDKEGWFDPEKPRVDVDRKHDWYLELANRRFVFWRMGNHRPRLAGDLTSDQAVFQTPVPFHEYHGNKGERKPIWETGYPNHPYEVDPKYLVWKYTPDAYTTEFQKAGMDAYRRPISLLSVNLTLGIRVAVRTVLGLSVDYPE
jgi:hypothetical protein